jgi:hypothetical protein
MLAARVEQKMRLHAESKEAQPHLTVTGRVGRATACADPTSEAARMSWPRRNKRSATRTMSSCSGVPARWAIKPIRTAGCAVKRSCNGELTEMAVLSTAPMPCAVERSLSAVRRHGALRQYIRDDALARHGCGRGERARGSSRGSRVERASGLGFRLSSPLCRWVQSSSAGDANYADPGGITFGNTCTYGDVPWPCVPSCKGSIIGQSGYASALDGRTERPVVPPVSEQFNSA